VEVITPKDRPGELEVRVKAKQADGAGKVRVKLDIATILTDVLDIVELQSRVWGTL